MYNVATSEWYNGWDETDYIWRQNQLRALQIYYDTLADFSSVWSRIGGLHTTPPPPTQMRGRADEV